MSDDSSTVLLVQIKVIRGHIPQIPFGVILCRAFLFSYMRRILNSFCSLVSFFFRYYIVCESSSSVYFD